MNDKDARQIADLYTLVLEKKKLSPKQKKIAAAAEPKDKITKEDFKSLKKGKPCRACSKKNKKTCNCESVSIDKKGKLFESAFNSAVQHLVEAYEQILENKHINKKFARRYNKVTGAMLKAVPGTDEYKALKAERDDLVSILKDHNMTAADLDALLVKKEKEMPLPEVPETPNTVNQYGDNTYSDTEDLENNTINVDFKNAYSQQETPSQEVSTQTDIAVNQ